MAKTQESSYLETRLLYNAPFLGPGLLLGLVTVPWLTFLPKGRWGELMVIPFPPLIHFFMANVGVRIHMPDVILNAGKQ